MIYQDTISAANHPVMTEDNTVVSERRVTSCSSDYLYYNPLY